MISRKGVFAWKLIKWLSSYYNTPIGLAAKVALPSELSTTYEPKKQTYVKIGSTNYESNISGEIQKKIYNYLKSKNKLLPISDLKKFSKNCLGRIVKDRLRKDEILWGAGKNYKK